MIGQFFHWLLWSAFIQQLEWEVWGRGPRECDWYMNRRWGEMKGGEREGEGEQFGKCHIY